MSLSHNIEFHLSYIRVKFPACKIILNLVFKCAASQTNLKWGFHCQEVTVVAVSIAVLMDIFVTNVFFVCCGYY